MARIATIYYLANDTEILITKLFYNRNKHLINTDEISYPNPH